MPASGRHYDFGGKLGISRTLGASLLTAAIVLGPVAAAVASPEPEVITASASDHLDSDSNRQTIIDVFDGVNAFRASKGLKPVKFNASISKVSQNWSERMATGNFFSHNPDYVSGVSDRWKAASENIAARWDRSGNDLVGQWVSSPLHNQNMSTRYWGYMGVGVAYSDNQGGRYSTYSTTNFFKYGQGMVLPGSYDHPRDFFAGKPALKIVAKPQTMTPKAPVFDTVKATYTIPHSMEGFTYYAVLNGQTSARFSGKYNARVGVTTIRAMADDGYEMPPGNFEWKMTYDGSTEKVSFSNPFTGSGKYVIPKTAGLSFYVNGKPVKSGEYKAPSRIVSITARAKSGYQITGTSTWKRNFRKTATPAKPGMSGLTNRYMIPAKTGVTYYVNGNLKKAGTYSVANGKTLNITTKASSSDYRLAGKIFWSYRF